MECLCAQTRPRFILSSEIVLGNGVRTHVNSKEKIPPTGKILPRGGWNPRRCVKQDSEPNKLPMRYPPPPPSLSLSLFNSTNFLHPHSKELCFCSFVCLLAFFGWFGLVWLLLFGFVDSRHIHIVSFYRFYRYSFTRWRQRVFGVGFFFIIRLLSRFGDIYYFFFHSKNSQYPHSLSFSGCSYNPIVSLSRSATSAFAELLSCVGGNGSVSLYRLCSTNCRLLQVRGLCHGGRRPSSDDSFHSPTVIPPSVLDKPSITKRYHRRRTFSHTSPRRSITMVTLRDTRFVECRWWNDGWTVKTVVT